MENQQKSDSILSYVIAIAPALLQLVAVFSKGLVEVIKFDQFVLHPNFINIANLLVILLSLSFISMSSFWDTNKFNLHLGENFLSLSGKFWRVLWAFVIIAVLTSISFMAIVLNRNNITSYIEAWSFFQWLSYVLFMTSTSFIVYTLILLKLQEKNSKNLQYNYVPRLLDSLRRNGHVKQPDIIIDSIGDDKSKATVRFGAKGPRYTVKTNFTGEMTEIHKEQNSEN